MSGDSGYTVVPFAESHIPEAAEIEALCFSDPWSANALRFLLPSDSVAAFTCIDEATGRVCAYCGMSYVLDEGEIVNVAVHPDYRRRGYARAVLGALFRFADAHGIRHLVLEVRASNVAAQALYRSLGFTEVGIMPAYYVKPVENACVMALERTENEDSGD